jgi:dienelactone hydrolase
VIIYVPDCGGLAPSVRSQGFDEEHLTLTAGLPDASREVFWARRLLSWGYAIVLVDGYTARGITDTCAEVKKGATKSADVYGTLAYVTKQPWADPKRIGVLGFLTGDHWRIPLAGDDTTYVMGPERFTAAVAFVYSPSCGVKSPMAAPTLVFNGVSASAMAETCPKVSAQAAAGGAPTEERVAPALFKNFEPHSPMPDKMIFSDWVASQAQNAAEAARQVKEFLAQHLRP